MTQSPEIWTDLLKRTLASYEDGLLRRVSGKLCKPRNHWPAQELLERCMATLDNAAVLDRRLKDLETPGRLALALMAHSRQNVWPVGNLVEMLVTLGHSDGLRAVHHLLEAGLLFPKLFPLDAEPGEPLAGRNRLREFDVWLSLALPPMVFAHPAVLERALGGLESMPDCPGAVGLRDAKAQEADGLEWPLRLAILWQKLAAVPLRRTQQQGFFKRDLDRIQDDVLLNLPPNESLAPIPDIGLFTVGLGLATGVAIEQEGEIRAGAFPAAWSEGLSAALMALWSAMPRLESWNPAQGWNIAAPSANPYASAYLLALVLLGRLAEDRWASPSELEKWLVKRHPYWAPGAASLDDQAARVNGKAKRAPAETDIGLKTLLLGIAFPLRLLEAAKDNSGTYMIRLSPLGRWVLGLAQDPGPYAGFPQTLLVQPNLEILAYRQGLTPELIAGLTRCATWKGLGAACTLQLEPHSVYRALEAGETFDNLVQMLERHGMKPVPLSVLDLLRTWSNKRDRISIYPAGALFEFPGPVELADALARGLPAVRLNDRLAIVPNESAIDYRHFRLIGTRDYCLPPEKCIDVEADGVTLSIDLARSDLLLETEVQGLAEPLTSRAAPPGRRLYGMTPASLAAARQAGWTLLSLESWFHQRTGQPLSAAAVLVFSSGDMPQQVLRRQLVLHAATPLAADGLLQWPPTRALIQQRLGPTALAVAEEHVEALQQRCRELGFEIKNGENS